MINIPYQVIPQAGVLIQAGEVVLKEFWASTLLNGFFLGFIDTNAVPAFGAALKYAFPMEFITLLTVKTDLTFNNGLVIVMSTDALVFGDPGADSGQIFGIMSML